MLPFVLLGAGALGGFFGGLYLLRRARLYEDTPTALIRSAAQGYVELEGHARLLPGPPISAPLSGGRCCWWRFKIEHREPDSRNRRWTVIEEETSGELFQLCDRSGDCVVDPQGARVIPSRRQVWYGPRPRPPWGPKMGQGLWRALSQDFRYTEELIEVGTPLYAVGQFRTQRGSEALSDPHVAFTELLGKWKRDPKMMALLDLNKDGRVDGEEWDAARRQARQQVQDAALAEMPGADVHVLCKPAARTPFILSARSQQQLAQADRWRGVTCLLAALACGAALVHLLTAVPI